MSDMYSEANKLKEMIKAFSFNEAQLNVLVKFGQVAKFRCKSNKAYSNFINACLEGSDYELTHDSIVKSDGSSFEVPRIVKKVIA